MRGSISSRLVITLILLAVLAAFATIYPVLGASGSGSLDSVNTFTSSTSSTASSFSSGGATLPISSADSRQPNPSAAPAGCTPGGGGAILVRGSIKGFSPSIVNVTVGQSVKWTMGPMGFICTFNQVGTFHYRCALHPFIVLTVNVKK